MIILMICCRKMLILCDLEINTVKNEVKNFSEKYNIDRLETHLTY